MARHHVRVDHYTRKDRQQETLVWFVLFWFVGLPVLGAVFLAGAVVFLPIMLVLQLLLDHWLLVAIAAAILLPFVWHAVEGRTKRRTEEERIARERFAEERRLADEKRVEEARLAHERTAEEERLRREEILKARTYALSCHKCGDLADPIPGSQNRYRCSKCGRQFAGARHHL